MSTRQKIYTADDIQRYLQQKMTPAEMHALERASLDDDFLADAIEGYAATPSGEHDKIIGQLKASIDEKTGQGAKVVEMKSSWKTWYRAAAVLVILLGSAAVFYTYISSDKNTNTTTVAKQEATSAEPAPATLSNNDTGSSVAANTPASSLNEKPAASSAEAADSGKKINPTKETVAITDNTIVKENKVQSSIPAETTNEAKKVAAAEQAKVALLKNATVTAENELADNARRMLNEKSAATSQNVFSGRVSGSNNEPLPYAHITIKNDSLHIGTYADINGNFSFVAPDTLLDVEVLAAGYLNQTHQLQKGPLSHNNIILSEDNANTAQIVVTGPAIKDKNSFQQSQIDSSALAEPDNGWDSYDTYLTNNLFLPQKEKLNTLHGTIELSFVVSKDGTPDNITVDKSLLNELDKQAVKALKEGPKWKYRNKNRKGKIVIQF